MSKRATYPKIAEVTPQPGKRLLVRFRNGESRLYDCAPLLRKAAFRALANDAFFRLARADEHGYGVVWSDEVDLAESEIWLRGRPLGTAAVRDGGGAVRANTRSKRRGEAAYPKAQRRRKTEA